VTSMTTPYGTTSFDKYTISTLLGPIDGLKISYPDCSHAVGENWYYLDTYFWDRHACELYPNDPTNGVHVHAVHTNYYTLSFLVEPVPATIQRPLESLETYSYLGATPGFLGTSGLPSMINKPIGNNLVTLTLGGSKTTSDVLSLTIHDNNL